MKARTLDFVCAVILAFFVVAKVVDFDSLAAAGWLPQLALAAETALILILVSGRTPRIGAVGLFMLGGAFAVNVMGAVGRPQAGACHCLGAIELNFKQHLLLAFVVLGLGSLQLVVLGHRSTSPRAPIRS